MQNGRSQRTERLEAPDRSSLPSTWRRMLWVLIKEGQSYSQAKSTMLMTLKLFASPPVLPHWQRLVIYTYKSFSNSSKHHDCLQKGLLALLSISMPDFAYSIVIVRRSLHVELRLPLKPFSEVLHTPLASNLLSVQLSHGKSASLPMIS